MDLVQVLPNALKCPCVSIKHALKKQGIKTPKPLISQGFQVSVSILVTQDGCGGRTRTYGLRVMSCFRMAQLTISGHFGQHCMQKRLLSGELGSAVSVYFFPFWVRTWVRNEKKQKKYPVIDSGKIEDSILCTMA